MCVVGPRKNGMVCGIGKSKCAHVMNVFVVCAHKGAELRMLWCFLTIVCSNSLNVVV